MTCSLQHQALRDYGDPEMSQIWFLPTKMEKTEEDDGHMIRSISESGTRGLAKPEK